MTASHTASIPCAVCQGTEVITVATKDRNAKPLQNVLCLGCGLVWVEPQPTKEETEQFYAKDYRKDYKGAFQPKPKHCYRETLRAIARASDCEPHLKQGMRILDIGSGAGFFPFVLLKKRIAIEGIEPNEAYAAFARETLGASQVQTGFLSDIKPSGQYDLITINHVFEHLPNPVEAISHINRLLKPGSKLLLEVPNIEATYHSPGKVFHVGHLYWYNPKTIETLASQAGFKTDQINVQPGTMHVSAAFIKQANPTGKALTMPGKLVHADLIANSASIKTILGSRSRLKHYLSAKPYKRFGRKMLQYAQEMLQANKIQDPRMICERVYASQGAAVHR